MKNRHVGTAQSFRLVTPTGLVVSLLLACGGPGAGTNDGGGDGSLVSDGAEREAAVLPVQPGGGRTKDAESDGAAEGAGSEAGVGASGGSGVGASGAGGSGASGGSGGSRGSGGATGTSGICKDDGMTVQQFVVRDCVTVLDTSTGLVWERWDSCSLVNHSQAMLSCRFMASKGVFGGLRDWRLPTAAELLSLVDVTSAPMINQIAFPDYSISEMMKGWPCYGITDCQIAGSLLDSWTSEGKAPGDLCYVCFEKGEKRCDGDGADGMRVRCVTSALISASPDGGSP